MLNLYYRRTSPSVRYLWREHSCLQRSRSRERMVGEFVPKGAVPLVISVAGFDSAPVTVAVK